MLVFSGNSYGMSELLILGKAVHRRQNQKLNTKKEESVHLSLTAV